MGQLFILHTKSNIMLPETLEESLNALEYYKALLSTSTNEKMKLVYMRRIDNLEAHIRVLRLKRKL
jgi:hypothetical protein